MAAIDTCKKIGINVNSASFSSVVSIAFSSAMESFRQNGIVPVRDGFEFTEMMSIFPETLKQQRGRALALTKMFELAGANNPTPAAAPKASSIEGKRKETRFHELAFRAEQDPLNVSQEEMEELNQLALELNP